MRTRPEQHGDIVTEVDISSAPIVRHRHTWRSALIDGAALLLLLLSLWFRSRERMVEASVLLVLVFAAHWLSRRWQVEERFPRPETKAHRQDYRILQVIEIGGMIAMLAWWFVWSERPGSLGIAAIGLVVGAVGGWWQLERAYRRLFERVAAEAPAMGR